MIALFFLYQAMIVDKTAWARNTRDDRDEKSFARTRLPMGWKARAREIAERDPDAVAPNLLADSSYPNSRRWPVIQKNAIRNAIIGITLIGAVFWAMHGLALGYDIDAGRLRTALVIVSCISAGLFCLIGESVIEDGVKSVIIGLTGCMFAWLFPLPWCLMPGAGAVVGSIVNSTIQATLGRYF